ncbi:TetR/AcrR family transcriptional regulator [Halomonas campisalis]|nr:TetR/AcrR family transcriptional regulator [Halomonas campisalis]MDR5863654.1 TetR/AcrR family transcriptional regulator [Halomonas campisalis]
MNSKKREIILNAATELFLESGYSRVSVDAIIARVGGSKRTIYSYFGDKDGLFSAIVHNLCDKIVSPLTDLDLRGLPPGQALKQLSETFFDVVLAPNTLELHRLVVAEAPRFPDAAKAFFASAPSVSYRCLANYFAWAQDEGLIKPGDSHQRAALFLDALTGDIQLRCLLGLVSEPDRARLAAAADEAVDIFLHGLMSNR